MSAEASPPPSAPPAPDPPAPDPSANPASNRVLHNFGSRVIAQIAPRFPQVEFTEIPTEDELPPELSGNILVTSTLGSPNLRHVLTRGIEWIHVLGTGVDRFPLDLLGRQTLTCSRGASAIPISEWVLAHLLAFEKHLPDVWLKKQPERWFFPERNAGLLHGRSLAIVGLGAIAVETARRALAFGMRVSAFRRTDKPAPLDEIRVVGSVAELVRDADNVLLACSLTEQTRGLADDAFFEGCREGVHFLNVARGELVDEAALRRALDGGKVARASLDTASGEPLGKKHWMYGHPQVRLTPHISWSEPDALARVYQDFEDNLGRWLAGQPLKGVVDAEAGY